MKNKDLIILLGLIKWFRQKFYPESSGEANNIIGGIEALIIQELDKNNEQK